MAFSKKLFSVSSLCLVTSCSSLSGHQEASVMDNVAKPAIYVFESDGNGFNTKTVFFDSGKEVVAFDAQFTPDAAQKALSFLRTKTASPLKYLVVTHPNPDKFNGGKVFRDAGAKIVESQASANAQDGVHAYKKYFFVNIAKMFTDQTYPQPVKADIVFTDTYTIRLNSAFTVELHELNKPGVSSNQTVAFIPAANALVVGDLVHYKAHAWLEGGIQSGKPVPTLLSWKQILKKLSTDYNKKNPIVYGGRGQDVQANVAFPAQTQYLQRAEAITKDFVAKNDEILRKDSQKAFAKLTHEFEVAFPDYALSYMIQYGIYGLTSQMMAK